MNDITAYLHDKVRSFSQDFVENYGNRNFTAWLSEEGNLSDVSSLSVYEATELMNKIYAFLRLSEREQVSLLHECREKFRHRARNRRGESYVEVPMARSIDLQPLGVASQNYLRACGFTGAMPIRNITVSQFESGVTSYSVEVHTYENFVAAKSKVQAAGWVMVGGTYTHKALPRARVYLTMSRYESKLTTLFRLSQITEWSNNE